MAVNRLLATAVASAALGAVLALSLAPSTAQEAAAEEDARLVAAVDVTPITKELKALGAELRAVRAAVADAEGLRGDVAKATAAAQALQEQVKLLHSGFADYAKATEPVITALKPVTRWRYRVLHTRSESVVQRLGREGWELVTASQDWLYFRRPMEDEEEK